MDLYVGVQFALGALGYWEAGGGSKRSSWEQEWGCFPVGGTISAILPAPSPPPPAESRYLWQVAEVFVLNGIVGAVQEFQEVARQEMECIGCGQLREEFLLLRLVVQDFCLWVAEEKKSRRFRRSLQLPQPSISPEP